jgi:hypothetical protein
MMNPHFRAPRMALLLLGLGAASGGALACSSCGCSLSTDWASQGYAAGEGLRFDLRTDYFNQNQLREGTGRVDRGAIELPAEREIQQKTINRSTTLSVDYTPNDLWGVNFSLPYHDRFHTTIVDGDTDISTSHGKGIGDLRVLGRYQGLVADRTVGLQFGLKFATGKFHDKFIDGPQEGEPLDRGLQPGTGTTDLLLGVYHFGSINKDWEYFGQALVQQSINSREDFKPGTGLNVNLGVRYAASPTITPHIQINIRSEKRESGSNADVENSGATLIYLSPGVSVKVKEGLSLYGYFQVPVYQRVNGLQIEPRYTVSVGLRYAM